MLICFPCRDHHNIRLKDIKQLGWRRKCGAVVAQLNNVDRHVDPLHHCLLLLPICIACEVVRHVALREFLESAGGLKRRQRKFVNFKSLALHRTHATIVKIETILVASPTSWRDRSMSMMRTMPLLSVVLFVKHTSLQPTMYSPPTRSPLLGW